MLPFFTFPLFHNHHQGNEKIKEIKITIGYQTHTCYNDDQGER